MARARFKATLRPSGRGGGGHVVEVPNEVVAALGGKGRILVQASFDGVPYRGSIVKMGGVMMLGVTKAIMAEAGAEPGDVLDVVVENDEAPREVEVPPELKLSFSHRREYVGYIVEAKKEETRARRVERSIEALADRAAE